MRITRRAYEILFLVIIAEIISAENRKISPLVDYCELQSCGNSRNHTGCAYSTDLHRLGERCNEASKVLSMSLEESEIQTILDRHNEIRQYVAAGNETRGNPGPQPPAAFMANLTWDAELALLAQIWANQCPRSEDLCRDVSRFRVGQSEMDTIYSNRSSTPDTVYLLSFIDKWYNQVVNFDSRNVHHFVSSRYLRTRDYTQIVWADTRKIGCGKMKYQKSDSFIRFVLICNYGPGGNYEYQRVYETIEPENTEKPEVLEKKDISNTNFTAKSNSNVIVNVKNSNAVLNIFFH